MHRALKGWGCRGTTSHVTNACQGVDTRYVRHEDARVGRSGILIAAFVALGLGAVSQSRGQVPVAPCSATVAGQPSFSASDLDELQSSRLIATHRSS
jgi:hypothetical protein